LKTKAALFVLALLSVAALFSARTSAASAWGSSGARDYTSLDGKKIGVVTGMINDEIAKNVLNAEVVYYADQSSGMTMLVATHEMDFARDVSNRVFYIEEGGIYEEGIPSDILDNPRKPKTKEFIFKIRSFSYDIKHRDIDFVEMHGGIENFCYRHAVDKKIAGKLQLMAEELIVGVIAPRYGECSLNLSFSEKLGGYELAASYGGESFDAVEAVRNDLPATLIRKSAQSLRHEYAGGINTITATL
jgi:polar amino acid transport system ATP-binding protein